MLAPSVIKGKIELLAAARAAALVVVCAVLCAGCGQHDARSLQHFMDDAIARDGALARCNQDRDAMRDDIECSNARRAAEAVAVANERARSAGLEIESERKLVALRDRSAIQERGELRAAAAAQAAAEAAYDAQWIDPSAPHAQDADGGADLNADASAGGETRAFGPPIGAPGLTENGQAFDYTVYADYDGQLPPRLTLELAAVTPPASDLRIARPELELDEAVIPRPFRDSVNGSTAAR